MTDYQELRRLAEQATSGPWHVEGLDVFTARQVWVAGGYHVRPEPPIAVGISPEPDYIAAASPDVILALLSERQANQDRIAELERARGRRRGLHVCSYCGTGYIHGSYSSHCETPGHMAVIREATRKRNRRAKARYKVSRGLPATWDEAKESLL